MHKTGVKQQSKRGMFKCGVVFVAPSSASHYLEGLFCLLWPESIERVEGAMSHVHAVSLRDSD